MEGVYLLHFDKELTGYKNAKRYGDDRHYLGCSTDIRHRVSQHLAAEGSVMTKTALEQGLDITLAAIFPGGLVEVEQMMTKTGVKRFCPLCLAETYVKESRESDVRKLQTARKCNQCQKTLKTGTTARVIGDKAECYWHRKR